MPLTYVQYLTTFRGTLIQPWECKEDKWWSSNMNRELYTFFSAIWINTVSQCRILHLNLHDSHLWVWNNHCLRILLRSVPGELHVVNFCIIKFCISQVSSSRWPPYCPIRCKHFLWNCRRKRLSPFSVKRQWCTPLCEQVTVTYPHTPSQGRHWGSHSFSHCVSLVQLGQWH